MHLRRSPIISTKEGLDLLESHTVNIEPKNLQACSHHQADASDQTAFLYQP